jgi:hypothetical protein
MKLITEQIEDVQILTEEKTERNSYTLRVSFFNQN